jgi:membrane-associated protease RseP (regulator of RpoE activity)
MIHGVIGALVLLGIYKFMNSKSEYEVTWQLAFVFIWVPGFLLFLLSIGLNLLNLSPVFAMLGYLFYFAVPFLILKYGLEFDRSPAIKFSAVVPIVAIATEIPFVILLGAGNA